MSLNAHFEPHTPLMPGRLARQVRTRAAEALAMAIAALAVILFLALVTWNASDPSFSTSTSNRPTNLLGAPGAALADILMQLIGLASVGLIVILIAWATDLWATKRLDRIRSRMLVAPIAVFLLAGALSSIRSFGAWPLSSALGGTMGETQALVIADILRTFGIPRPSAIGTLALLAVSLLGFSYATGLTFEAIVAAIQRHGGSTRVGQGASYGAAPSVAPAPNAAITNPPREQNSLPPPVVANSAHEPSRPTMDVPAEPLVAQLGVGQHTKEPTLEFPQRSPVREREHAVDAPITAEPQQRVDDDHHAAPIEEPLPRMLQRGQNTNVAATAEAQTPPRQSTPSVSSVIRALREEEHLAQRGALVEGAQHAPQRRIRPLARFTQPFEPEQDVPQRRRDNATDVMRRVTTTMAALGIDARIGAVHDGPVSIVAFVDVPPLTNFVRVQSLERDIIADANLPGLNIFPGEKPGELVLEVPHSEPAAIALSDIVSESAFRITPAAIPLAVGRTSAGELVLDNLVEYRHLLIGGGDGTASARCLRAVMLAPLFRIDGAGLEYLVMDAGAASEPTLAAFAKLPHQAHEFALGLQAARSALATLGHIVDDRQRAMAAIAVHDIESFNVRVRQNAKREKILGRSANAEHFLSAMPRLVAAIDHFEALIAHAPRETINALSHILDYGPDCGVHVIAHLQADPSGLLPPMLRDRFGARLVFAQPTKSASIELLGHAGAEYLERPQDAVFVTPSSEPLRLHVVEASSAEAESIISSLSSDGGNTQPTAGASVDASKKKEPEVVKDDVDEALYERAINIVLRDRRAYSGHLARTLNLDRPRAVALIDRMVEDGIVSAPDEGGNQRVLLERRATVVRV